MSFNLPIPTQANGTSLEIAIEPGTSAIFVGANGSGKTRLAVYMESAVGEHAHRISAHRALTLKPEVPKIRESEALRGLRYGHTDEGMRVDHRSGHRWRNGKPAVSLLDDFDFLIQALFADQSRVALVTHANVRAGTTHKASPTKLERLKEITCYVIANS